MATETQYTVKVPLNPTGFPSTDKVVIWDTSEGMFNLSDVAGGSSCIKWYYDSNTSPTGISNTFVRFNNSSITGATEIYIHKDALSGSNDWSDYFQKLKIYCCTLTVSIPENPNDYIVFDYNKTGSTWNGTYLTFVVSDVINAPLVNDSDFPTLSTRDELCLSFDLFLCEVVKNPKPNSIVTSDGSGTTVYGHSTLLFDGNTLELTGDTKFEGDRYDQSANVVASTIGYNNIHSIPTASGTSVYFHYVVKERTNGYMRSGSVMTVNNGTNSSYTDVSTPDIVGSTKDIQFSVRISGSDLQLRADVISGSWDVKIRTEVIFT